MANIFSPKQLESHLWEAANVLRGPVDAADFKSYVFPLLFFKRISDVHGEEYQPRRRSTSPMIGTVACSRLRYTEKP